MAKHKHRSGFASILGRPNAGKSTLLNAFLGSKLAITASKPQTTRTAVQGVLTADNAQIVFIDTPGIHKSDSMINKRMMETVRGATKDRDVLLFLADASVPFGAEDAQAIDLVKKAEAPVLLVLNKIDRLERKDDLLKRLEEYRGAHDFAEFIPISAIQGEGLDVLKKAVIDRLPVGPAFYPADYITDQPERFLAGELIREKILNETRQEVPHAVAVLIEKWEDTAPEGARTKNKMIRISATVYVERDGQKAIIIGAGGTVLKKIGTEARLDIEQLLARKVFLELFVKVRANWREDPGFLNEIDWRSMAGM